MTINLLPDRFFRKSLRRFPSFFWPSFADEDLLPSSEETTMGTRIYEEHNQLHIEAPLPGLNHDDIEVSLNRGVLLIKGKKEEKEEDKEKKYYSFSRREYSFSLPLPTQIDEKQEPQAEYENGILKVTLQLAHQGETKRITVKGGNKKK